MKLEQNCESLVAGDPCLLLSTGMILKPLPPCGGHAHHTIVCADYGPFLNSSDLFFLLGHKYNSTIIKDRLRQLSERPGSLTLHPFLRTGLPYGLLATS